MQLKHILFNSIGNGIIMLDRKEKIKTKACLPAHQAASQQPDQQGSGNKGTEKAIFHLGQEAPLIFRRAMQMYSGQKISHQQD